MVKPRPVFIAAASVCLLQACATAPEPASSRTMKMEPLLMVQNSGSQTAATYYQLGKYHQERGNKLEARAAFVQSIGLDRRQVEARNALAVLDSEEGRLDEAIAMLVQLARDYPRIAYLHNNLAYAQLLRGEPDSAIASLEKALALEPGNVRALKNLDLVQTALLEKRDKLTAALGLADAIVEKTGGAAGMAPRDAGKSASTGQALATRAIVTGHYVPLPAPPAVTAPELPMFDVQQPKSHMEVVQILPNVIELRQRQRPVLMVADRPHEKVERPEKPEKPVELKVLTSPLQARQFRFDVANGNGVPGMALRMRDALARRGIQVTRVINKRPFNTQSTEIQYLVGFEQEAERVRAAMTSHVTMRPVSSIAGTQEVRLVLGKDAAAHATLMGEAPMLAMAGTQAR